MVYHTKEIQELADELGCTFAEACKMWYEAELIFEELKNKKKGFKKMNYIDIQNEVISKYRIDLCDGTKCASDWHRTHAHIKQRRVCKWTQANSIQSTFTLLHEVGHIETTKSGMRRAEEEYFATVWAIKEAKKYGIEIPRKIIDSYQRYIDMEKARGLRRGGDGYAELKLKEI